MLTSDSQEGVEIHFREFMSNMTWTDKIRQEFERVELLGEQTSFCARLEPPTSTNSNLPELQKDRHVVTFPSLSSLSVRMTPANIVVVVTMTLLFLYRSS